jgi:type IV pilus assembly protein PilA
MKKMNNKGFSLIELIIVIAIMAILVAIIAPNLTKYLGKSKTKTDAKNLDEVKQQVQNAISDASTDEVAVTTGTITVQASGGNVTCSDTTAFGDILETVLKGSNTKSKVDTSKTKISFDISGSVSGGYEVTNVKFVS